MNASELILNSDGTVFHLHITGQMIADNVILVGDPKRAEYISTYFDKVLYHAENREFKTFTGTYNGMLLTVMSTGIGVGNIDIAINELNIAANYNLEERKKADNFRHLNLIRLGTCGTVQPDLHIGDYIASEYSIGTDALAFYYAGSEKVRDIKLEESFIKDVSWGNNMPVLYAVKNTPDLLSMFDSISHRGITISAVGFYGPQGRNVELTPWKTNLIESVADFKYNALRVLNFEMEGASLGFLSSMLGHSSVTICAVIAERAAGNGNPNYSKIIQTLIEYTLERITK